jgi:hypothetical protein
MQLHMNFKLLYETNIYSNDYIGLPSFNIL